jgi:magnesium chelatase family protein
MLSIVKSMSLQGLEGFLVDVQVDISAGMPNWEVVGLPDASVREAKERVRTAIKNSGYDFHSRRIVINLAPADTKKEGSFFDLPIALGILMDFQNIKCQNLEDTVFIGELSLNGNINKVNGILPMCIEAKKLGIRKIILSSENAKEAAIVEGLTVIGARNLTEVVEYLNGERLIQSTKSDLKQAINQKGKYAFDFSEVRGQENVKRALEIAAARRS